MALPSRYLIMVLGPTAVGKTDLCIRLAQHFGTEILSADSRQIYRELSIGTAKPTAKEQAGIPHHFINHLSIVDDYSASQFEVEALAVMERLYQKYKTVIMTGGSGLYLDAISNGFDVDLPTADPELRKKLNEGFEKEGIAYLQTQLEQLDPAFYAEVDQNNPKRLLRAIEVCLLSGRPYSELRQGKKANRPFQIIKIGLERDRELLYQRINRRVDLMMKDGLEAEAKAVYDFRENNALKTVGYRELFLYLEGKYRLDEAVEKIKVNSRRYAKRQMTWFKRDASIQWFQPDDWQGIVHYLESKTAHE